MNDRTVHVVLNAHLDPSWLWPWQAGIDEAIATCRSACDRLDAHPEAVFTRGEAWVYRQIELCEPDLLERIRAHVAAGRWSIVGGWWIQPDCNGPSAWAMDRQVELGLEYFDRVFGTHPRTAYNVDSFGHAAYLPKLMRDHGQDRYVMMRPQEHERELPARVFKWRGYEDGPEVTVFRIAGSYCTEEPTVEHIQKSLMELPDGCRHTMCFVGIGDHGGGPTERTLARLEELRDSLPGVKLEYSSPDRFFDAIESDGVCLPQVVGEMQMHAVGCYSVCHGLKQSVRKAENLLRQAESVALQAQLKQAWEQVAFAHFHDVYGGTCIPGAYPQIEDQLGFARCVADTELQLHLRRRMADLPDDEDQRVVILNASDQSSAGHAEFEPWLDSRGRLSGSDPLGLVDVAGAPVPTQRLTAEAAFSGMPRLLFPAELAPGELKVLRLRRTTAPPEPGVTAANGRIANDLDVAFDAHGMHFGNGNWGMPSLHLIPDPTDTWSHGVDRYDEVPCGIGQSGELQLVDTGPLMTSAFQSGTIGESRFDAEWRVYAGEPYVELRLKVFWSERRKILKLVVESDERPETRVEGVMGGVLERFNDGAERPFRDLVVWGDRRIVCPDVFAADATPDRLRMTLLRSPVMAHHLPHDGNSPRATISDQGTHEFRFRFYGPSVALDRMELDASAMQRPLLFGDLTRGMKP
jgi:alpha-mannosidase